MRQRWVPDLKTRKRWESIIAFRGRQRHQLIIVTARETPLSDGIDRFMIIVPLAEFQTESSCLGYQTVAYAQTHDKIRDSRKGTDIILSPRPIIPDLRETIRHTNDHLSGCSFQSSTDVKRFFSCDVYIKLFLMHLVNSSQVSLIF